MLEFFELVLALRRWANLPEPDDVLFSRYWVAEWTGLHEQTVKRAIAELRRPAHPLGTAGLLLFAGEMPPRRGQPRGTYVFRPGGRRRPRKFAAVLPAEADGVEADDAARVDEREAVGDHAAVLVQ